MMQNSNQAWVQKSNFDWIIAHFWYQAGVRIWQVYQFAWSANELTSVICPFFYIHFSVQSLGFKNINCLSLRILVRLQKDVARVKWLLFDRLCKSVNLWNSHAGLAPEASNIPNKIKFWTEAWFEFCIVYPTNRLLKWFLKSKLQ